MQTPDPIDRLEHFIIRLIALIALILLAISFLMPEIERAYAHCQKCWTRIQAGETIE